MVKYGPKLQQLPPAGQKSRESLPEYARSLQFLECLKKVEQMELWINVFPDSIKCHRTGDNDAEDFLVVNWLLYSMVNGLVRESCLRVLIPTFREFTFHTPRHISAGTLKKVLFPIALLAPLVERDLNVRFRGLPDEVVEYLTDESFELSERQDVFEELERWRGQAELLLSACDSRELSSRLQAMASALDDMWSSIAVVDQQAERVIWDGLQEYGMFVAKMTALVREVEEESDVLDATPGADKEDV